MKRALAVMLLLGSPFLAFNLLVGQFISYAPIIPEGCEYEVGSRESIDQALRHATYVTRYSTMNMVYGQANWLGLGFIVSSFGWAICLWRSSAGSKQRGQPEQE